ncbi:MAG: PocR ligand-binding domain-containing protein [Methanosarcinales archaeon]|nr:PocR ligand-binding domain-containing protein [Methanosarcinales archaeon]
MSKSDLINLKQIIWNITAYKTIISIIFGLMGFAVNFYSLDFVFYGSYKISFLLGLVFPMLITLAWGWKYGLLSALCGGCQTMWILWMPQSGYAPLVSVPPFTLWIVWHGWFSRTKYNIYFVELIFRIFNTALLYTVFRWIFTLNTSPANIFMPLEVTHSIVFKEAVNGLLIIFLAQGLLYSDSVRAFFKLSKSTADPRFFYIYTNTVILSGILIFSFAGEKYIWGLWDSGFQSAARILGSILILMVGILCTYGIANVFVKRKSEELIKAQEELQKNEKKLSQIIEGSPIATLVLDNEHTITHWNKACENLTGASMSEMVGTKNTWKPFYSTQRPVMGDVIVDELLEEEISRYYGGKYQKSTIIEGIYEVEDFFPDMGDSGKWVFFTATPLRDDQGGIIGAIETLQDISERKRLEDRMVHLNLVLRAIRNVNQLITKEKDRDRLLQGACNNLIETRGYHNAWIALLDESGRLVTTAQAGLGDIFELMIARLKQGKLIECAKKALRRSDVILIDDPVSTCTDCPLVEQYEGRRAMTIRLEHGEKVYGLLSVAVPAVLAADNQEQALFREVAEDIAFALYSIELERERKKTEEALKHKLLVLSQPVGEISDIKLQDIIDTDILQELQDNFAKSYGVAALIFDKEGKPITKPGNFSEFCRIIRDTEKGKRRCEISDAYLVSAVTDGSFALTACRNFKEIQDAAVPIFIGDNRVATWGIGQRLISDLPEEKIRSYAEEIGADPDELAAAGNKLEPGSKELFEVAVSFLESVANNISLLGLQNIQQSREIVKRERAEVKLKETVADLKRSNSELEQFAYVASHDLQEPLRMISSYVQLLQRRYKDRLDTDADDFIGYAVDGANRMQMLINDLLIFSRVGTRGKPFEPTDCEAVLGKVLTNLEVSIKESSAEITHDALPTVMADGSQLILLLQNLIRNAIKFHSEKLPRIHVSAKRSESEYIFSVADNGIGIEAEFYDRIFVIFQRLHGRDEYSGTGIGLAVCRKIVERHGGRIWVESESGKGTTFFFTMPIEGGKQE